MCPLLNIELLINIVVIVNNGEEKSQCSDHRGFLDSAHDVEFEQEPVHI